MIQPETGSGKLTNLNTQCFPMEKSSGICYKMQKSCTVPATQGEKQMEKLFVTKRYWEISPQSSCLKTIAHGTTEGMVKHWI